MSSNSGGRTALYRFFRKDGKLLYVGITDNLGQRWSSHMRSKEWWPKVHKQTSEWFPNREAAAAAEVKAIKSERPIYNINHAARDEEKAQPPRFVVLSISRGKQQRRPARHKTVFDGIATLENARDLLADIDEILDEDRVRLAEIPPRLRAFAPQWDPYLGLNGVRLAAILKQCGVRITRTNGVPRLDPKDLRMVRAESA